MTTPRVVFVHHCTGASSGLDTAPEGACAPRAHVCKWNPEPAGSTGFGGRPALYGRVRAGSAHSQEPAGSGPGEPGPVKTPVLPSQFIFPVESESWSFARYWCIMSALALSLSLIPASMIAAQLNRGAM